MGENKTYEIGNIAVSLDKNGEITYWVYMWGWFPEQGGMGFTRGNFGTKSAKDLGTLLASNLERSEKDYKSTIQEKEAVEHEQL